MRSHDPRLGVSTRMSGPDGRTDNVASTFAPEHLTFDDAAEWLRCSTRTLQRLVETGRGPPIIRLSQRRVIFRLADLRIWLAQRTRGATGLLQSRQRGRPRKEVAATGAEPV